MLWVASRRAAKPPLERRVRRHTETDMACPKCGCKTTYQYDDEGDPQDDRLERCAACGEVFDVEDHAEEEDDEH